MSAGPARALGLPEPRHRGRRAREPRPARPRGGVDGRPRPASARARPTRGCSASALRGAVAEDGRRRPGGARMSAFLALEDGTIFRGESVGADGRRVRRGGLHDRDDRLPGDRHRSELRRAARLLHGADGRQLRRRRRPRRVAGRAREGGADAGGARARVDGLARRARDRRADRDRHALARAAPARGRRDARGGRRRRAGRGRRRSPRSRELPPMAGAALVGPGLDARAVRLLRRGHDPGRGRRLRLQALDPAPARRRRRARDRLSRTRPTPTSSRATTPSCSRTAPATRSRSTTRSRSIARAARPRARARDLPRPPAARPRDRATRRSSSPSATAAPTTPCSSGAAAACS